MKFRSQRVSYLFFATSMALFALQIVFGFIMAFAHMGYDGLHEFIPFNAARTSHLNLLVFWLLSGFMGAAYYIVPEEAERELVSEKLAVVQWAGLVIVGVTALIGFSRFRAHSTTWSSSTSSCSCTSWAAPRFRRLASQRPGACSFSV